MTARVVLLGVLTAASALAQGTGEPTYDLTPHYTLGGELEGEARLGLELTVRIQVASQNLDHRSLQAQRIERRFRDRVTEVRGGKIAAVERTYLEAFESQRLPGAAKFQRLESPLSGRTLTVGLDAAGKRTVTVEGEPALQPSDTEHEVHTERYEAALPDAPVSVGDSWTWGGDRLRRAVGNGFGERPEGKLVCRFMEVKEEALDPELTPDAAPRRYAIVQVDLETEGSLSSSDEGAPRMTCHLTGNLWFDLEERKLAKLELQGQAHLESVEREGDAERRITATGPLTVSKRFWFPRKPEPPEDAAPEGGESGLPGPGR
ncbi:MAG: hypothetical protein R3F62_09000 [Planctomycetota bacterium]